MATMQIRIKKLDPRALIPVQGSISAAGYDLTAIEKKWDEEHDCFVYRTGLAFEIPVGYAGFIFPRSSIYKMVNRMSNCVGVIDSDYRGEVTVVFDYGNNSGMEYDVGDRVAQIVIMPVVDVWFREADELSETERGTNGYGSTGR